MKLKTVQAILKSGKNIILFEGESEQWIGDGYAAYPLHGLPRMKEENLQAFFDMTSSQYDKLTVKTQKNNLDIEDNSLGEIDLEYGGADISYHGKEVVPLIGSERIFYIQSKYIKPFSDELRYSARRYGNGDFIIAVKEGFFLKALIAPYDCIDRDFIDTLVKLYRVTVNTLSQKQMYQRQQTVQEDFQNLELEETEADEA